jgi:hypothetical protein
MARSSYSGTEVIGVLSGTNTAIVSTKGPILVVCDWARKVVPAGEVRFQASVNTLPQRTSRMKLSHRPAGLKKQ